MFYIWRLVFKQVAYLEAQVQKAKRKLAKSTVAALR